MRAAVVFAAALLMTGCPGNEQGDVSQKGEPRTSTATQNPQSQPERTGKMNPMVPNDTAFPANRIPAAATVTVQVQLSEYSIQIPDMLQAGRYTLSIANAGKMNHNFAIEGPGLQTKLVNDLTRGDTTSLDVTLQAGTYTIYCPVDGHRGRGMQRTLTVTSSPAQTKT